MRRSILALVALVVAGCGGGSPDNSLLKPGQVMVVATDDALLFGTNDPQSPRLAPGATVRVGLDPGYFDLTQELIDAQRKDAHFFPDADISRGPRRIAAGEAGSGYRRIKVTIESGEFRGRDGAVWRRELRPLP